MNQRIFWPDWVGVLKNINGKTATEYCQMYAKTYSHIYNVAKHLEEQNLLLSEKKGRKVVFEWTNKGRRVAERLIEVDKILKGTESEDESEDERGV